MSHCDVRIAPDDPHDQTLWQTFREAHADRTGGRSAQAMKGRAIPVLPTRDTQRTLAFYQRLGFANTGADEWSNDYLVLRAGEVEIHFFRWDDLEPLASGALCHIRVSDADALHRLWAPLGLPAEGAPRLTAPSDTPWGVRQFALVDPDGNCLSCGHSAEAAAAEA